MTTIRNYPSDYPIRLTFSLRCPLTSLLLGSPTLCGQEWRGKDICFGCEMMILTSEMCAFLVTCVVALRCAHFSLRALLLDYGSEFWEHWIPFHLPWASDSGTESCFSVMCGAGIDRKRIRVS
ncbi:hypothetical protein AVEN_254109-1 [Araneus ventricosus]|uniref:Uncharacterized protein n=1 Tax=Araneus ventricosus TaxID=182803 RepID=A0A4Y2BYS5_ARAVE|nr:hypothetical protein AVEN_254109-1 [Araneus ventricosus]